MCDNTCALLLPSFSDCVPVKRHYQYWAAYVYKSTNTHNLLTEEFLDQDCIINEIFGQIYHSKPLSEDYTSVKHFLTKVRADFHELKSSCGLDFFKEGTSGNRLLSYVIFSKLPGVLQKEIILWARTIHLWDKYLCPIVTSYGRLSSRSP